MFLRVGVWLLIVVVAVVLLFCCLARVCLSFLFYLFLFFHFLSRNPTLQNAQLHLHKLQIRLASQALISCLSRTLFCPIQLFSDYFGGAPKLNIPGYTFPVEEFFLEVRGERGE